MPRKNSNLVVLFVLAILLTIGFSSSSFAGIPNQTAYGTHFGASYIQYWGSDCTPYSQNSLQPNASIVTYFVSQMQKYGAYRAFFFSNNTVWASDVTDRSVGWGNDSVYADSVDLFVYQGHGGSSYDSFFAPMCMPSDWKTWSSQRQYDEAYFRSQNARFNEKLRWLIMSTCHGLESRPDLVWKKAAGPGFEFIMGYKGDSYSAPSTDEILGDWVDDVYDDNDTFKQAWFSAASDWFFAQTPSVIAFDDSLSGAINRRDGQRYYWARRSGSSYPYVSAWAWKQWGGIYPWRSSEKEKGNWNYYSTN